MRLEIQIAFTSHPSGVVRGLLSIEGRHAGRIDPPIVRLSFVTDDLSKKNLRHWGATHIGGADKQD